MGFNSGFKGLIDSVCVCVCARVRARARVYFNTCTRARFIGCSRISVLVHSCTFASSVGFCVDKQHYRVNIHIYSTGK